MKIVMLAFTNLEYTIELTEALAEREDVILLIPETQKVRFDKIKPHLKVITFFCPRIRHLTNIYMLYKIAKILNRFKPDILHIQKGHPWVNYALPFLRKRALITTIHDVELRDWQSKKIPYFTHLPPIFFASKVIVHGDKLKEDLIRINNKLPSAVYSLKRGVNSIYTRYIEQEIATEKHTIMFFGRIWEYKGLDYLIKAEPLISAKIPDLKIIIAGRGENIGKYRAMMINPERFLLYNEFIPNKLVAELFQRCSLIVLPYTSASQSGIIPQAYAFRKPVVVSDVGSLKENVIENVTGIVVPPADVQKLAAAVIELLLDDNRREKMAAAAYEYTRGELAWSAIAEKTSAVYKAALAKC